MVLVHGINGHAMFEFMNADNLGRHCVFEGSLADKLSRSGYHVFAYDQQGHGLSDGLFGNKCYIEKFDHLASDLLQFSTLARTSAEETERGSPLFVVGESLGGGVAFRAAQLDGQMFSGLVLLAPMLSVERLAAQPINKVIRPIGSFFSRVLPRARIVHMPPSQKFPHLSSEFKADPLTDPKSNWVRARTAAEILEFCQNATRSCSQIVTPLLTMHSQDDTCVDPESSEILCRDAQTTDKTFLRVDNMWHALLHEPGADEVISKILEWVKERT